MRPSHICRSCGHDLARVRARRDRATGLLVVSCPACAGWQLGLASRGLTPRHRLSAGTVRSDATATALLASLPLLAFGVVLAAAGSLREIDITRRNFADPEDIGEVVLMVSVSGLCCLFVAILSVFAFRHWRSPWFALALWAGLFVCVFWPRPIEPWLRRVPSIVDSLVKREVLAFDPLRAREDWPRTTVSLLVTIVIATIGTTLVRGVILRAQAASSRKFRLLRRVLRRRQPWRSSNVT